MPIPLDLDATAFANEDDSEYAGGVASPTVFDDNAQPHLVLRTEPRDPKKSRGHLDDLGLGILAFLSLLEPQARALRGPAREALEDYANAAVVCFFRLRHEQDSITRSISEN